LSEEHSFPDIDAQVNNLKSTVLHAQHHIGKAPASGIVWSSAFLVSGYEFLLVLILGREYGIINMVKRDG